MTVPSRRPKPRRRLPPEVLSPDEVNALIAACKGDGYTSIRNRALIAVLYRSGLRIAEALSLYPKDVDPERSSIRVLRGKGGKSRTVGIDAGGLALLAPWLARRARMGFNGVQPLFCSAWGQPLATGYIRRLLPTLARRAGIAKRVHAHGLRHTHAAELREEGVDIGVISKQLGHSDISTTARYLDHIAPWAVIEAVRVRRWTTPSPPSNGGGGRANHGAAAPPTAAQQQHTVSFQAGREGGGGARDLHRRTLSARY